MTGARPAKNSANSGPKNTGFTLVDLLNQEQPYKDFGQLVDPEVSIFVDDKSNDKIRRIQGSLMGLAIGDAIGAPVEFRPNTYLKEHIVKDMLSGGTWGLEKGQWTDDTSMALCLAASLIVKGEFNAYDQFVRYGNWFRKGYMSSTGKCFDIGKSTREAITEFENSQTKVRNKLIAQNRRADDPDLETRVESEMRNSKNRLEFGTSESAGNGPLMRLAPIPCFFSDSYENVMEHINEATRLTHGDPRAIDACRFYAGLIWYALKGTSKEELLDKNFYQDTLKLKLHPDIKQVAEGSYKTKNGYEGGIRGKGYVVNSLEAALWAFYKDGRDFKEGVLLAVNLGDDTDTTAAIYGQLAGAVYGINNIPSNWTSQLFQGEFIRTVATGLYVKGENSRNNSKRSDRSGASNRNRDDGKASGTSETRHDPYSGATNKNPNPSQETNKDGTPNQKEDTGNAGHTGDNSNTDASPSNEQRPIIIDED